MKNIFFIIFALAFILNVSCEESDVIVLTESNFDEQTAQGSWLLEFYAPWCGHCKKLAPVYEQVATKLKGNVNVGKVDCTAEKGLQDRFRVTGYPTLKFLKEGQVYDYANARTLEALVDFVSTGYSSLTPKPLPVASPKKAEEPVKEEPKQEYKIPDHILNKLNSKSDVVELTEDNFDDSIAKGDWLLEFYAPWCGHCKKLAPIYEELATAVKGKFNVAKIDCTAEDGLATRFGVRGFPTLKFYHDGQLYDFNGQRTVEGLTSFLETGYTSVTPKPLPPPGPKTEKKKAPEPAPAKTAGTSDVTVLTHGNFDHTNNGVWFVEFYAPWCGHCKKLAPIYEEAATSMKGKVNFGKVDCTVQTDLCEKFDVRGYPTIYMIKDNAMYEFSGDRSVQGFKNFAESGWQSASADTLPTATSIKAYIRNAVRGIENLLHINFFVAIGVFFIIGIVLGIVIIVISPPAAPAATPSSQNATNQGQNMVPNADPSHPKND